MEPGICKDITAERVRRVAGGYTNAKGDKVEGLGGGFQYCRLSKEPLFDATGAVREDVRFAQLAEFVWFAETGTGLHGKAASPLLGVHYGVAVYLLYNGILSPQVPGAFRADPASIGGRLGLRQRLHPRQYGRRGKLDCRGAVVRTHPAPTAGG